MPKSSVNTLDRLLVVFLILVCSAKTSWSLPTSPSADVLHAKASIYFHSKQYADCLQAVDKLLAVYPNYEAGWELKALAQRNLNQDAAAVETYENLLKIATKEKKPAYSFDLGNVLFKIKRNAEARNHLEYSAFHGFNPGMSSFLVGMIDLGNKDWRKAAKFLASSLTHGDAISVRPLARYYYAMALSQSGQSEEAIKEYSQSVMDKSDQNPEFAGASTGVNKQVAGMTGEIRKNAIKALKAFHRSTSFASLTYLSQWDSNVSLLPSDVSPGQLGSGQRTMKAIFTGTAGYATSPTKRWQGIGSMTLYTNYNLNPESRQLNFFSTTPSVYALYRPYARLTPGIKFEGTFNMKKQFSSADNTDIYRKYSLTGDIGPLVKYELSPKVTLGYEATWRPKKFYLDTIDGDDRRTGHGFFTRLTGTINSLFTWWSPTAYMNYEFDNTYGKTWRFTSVGGGISNPIALSDQLLMTGTLDITSYDYAVASSKHTDVVMALRATASYTLTSAWTLMSDLGYTKSDSSLSSTFKYNRVTASLGATYSF